MSLMSLMPLINSKDKNTYLKLQVNQVRKRSKKKKVRAMEQLHIYLHSSQLENPLVPG